MKAVQRNTKRGHAGACGFSLVELLVAITVIVVLAGLTLSAIVAVRCHMREMAARSEVKNLETAWRQYYAQYQKWPSFAINEADGIAVTGNVARILQGENVGGDNRKLLVFTQFSRFDQNTNPVNPWGRTAPLSADSYYYVKFDLDYDNVIGVDADEPPSNDVRSAVIVWTFNADVSASDPEYVIGSW